MRSILLLLMATFLVASNDATAQQPRPQLSIVIDGIDDDATKCGVTRPQLESIAALTLRNNGIQVAGETTNPYLYLQVGFIATPARGCVYDLSVTVEGLSLFDLAKSPFGAFKARRNSSTVLCRDSSLGIAPQGRVATNVTGVLENVIKQCLGKLDY